MNRIGKMLSILLCFVLVLQTGGGLVFADGMPGAYWGQSFTAEEDYGALPCTAMFYHEAGVTNYEFKLFKDGVEVYTNRIEEGLSEDFSCWEEEYLFLDKFSQYGTGSYHFTVSSLTGDGSEIDEAEIIETVTSETFAYTQPATALSVPMATNTSPTNATWKATDENTYGYLYDLEVHYSNGTVYDPDYTERYTNETYFDPEEIVSALDYLQNYNPEKYPKSSAIIKVRVRAMPEDVREFQPSDYSAWMSVKVQSASSGGGGGAAVDRFAVDQALYDYAKVIYDLGIMPEVYTKAKNNVTIGDIAPILVALMGMEETAKASADYVTFSDTVAGEYLTGCINTLYYKKILSGQGDGTAGVNVELLYPQIVKMLVGICGYEPLATQYGGYPNGYLAVASRYGILKNVTGLSTESTVTHEQLSQLVYNALHTKLMKVESYSINGNTYKVTDDTMLYQLGYVRYVGDVTLKEDAIASITGNLYELDNPKGIAVTDKSLIIEDREMLQYQIPKMTLYVKSGGIVSALEVYQAIAKVNNDNYTATSWMVPISLSAVGYTKYKINDGAYAPIPKEDVYHWLGSKKSQYYDIRITFANEDETRYTTVKDGVKLEMKREITWMVNGEEYKTGTAVVGETIILPESPYLANHAFDGWIAVPEIMPDKDIVLHAKMTPTVKVTGTLTYKGEPVVNAYVSVNGNYQNYTNADGQYTATLPVGESVVSVYASSCNINESFMVTADETTTDIGTYALSAVAEKVSVSKQGILKADGLKELLDEEDYIYAGTEDNKICVQMNSYTVSENANISAYMQEHYPDYTMTNLQDITLKKVKSGTESKTEPITDAKNLISVTLAIPATQQGKADYLVLREHDGVVDAITEVPNTDGECITEVKDDSVTFQVKKFSAYGVIGTGIGPDDTAYIMNTNRTALNSIMVDVVVPENPKADAVLFVAFYDSEGKMIALRTRTEMASSETFTIAEDAFEIKAYIWDGNLKPLHQ